MGFIFIGMLVVVSNFALKFDCRLFTNLIVEEGRINESHQLFTGMGSIGAYHSCS